MTTQEETAAQVAAVLSRLNRLIALELRRPDAARYDRVGQLARVGKLVATLHSVSAGELEEFATVQVGRATMGHLYPSAEQADLHREAIATLRPIAEAAERLCALLPPVETPDQISRETPP